MIFFMGVWLFTRLGCCTHALYCGIAQRDTSIKGTRRKKSIDGIVASAPDPTSSTIPQPNPSLNLTTNVYIEACLTGQTLS